MIGSIAQYRMHFGCVVFLGREGVRSYGLDGSVSGVTDVAGAPSRRHAPNRLEGLASDQGDLAEEPGSSGGWEKLWDCGRWTAKGIPSVQQKVCVMPSIDQEQQYRFVFLDRLDR